MPTARVHIISHRSEMGQGIRTGLPAVVADEMEADWDRVEVEQATGDAMYGNQNTDGSWSVRGFMQRMREAGATARLMLEQAAAQEWGVDVAECRLNCIRVHTAPAAASLDYWDLVAGAAALPVPGLELLSLKSPDQFRYIGKTLPIVDMDDMTHGAPIRRGYPASRHEVCRHSAPAGGFRKVKSYDADQALAQSGVEQVLEIAGSGAAGHVQGTGRRCGHRR